MPTKEQLLNEAWAAYLEAKAPLWAAYLEAKACILAMED
jgi:hypothetical protein